MSPAEPCALCGLEIEGSPVVRTVGGAEKHFCCPGCARVYEVAHESGMLDQVLPAAPAPRRQRRDPAHGPGQTAYFAVQGMWCAGCATAAEQVLRKQPGVRAVDVSFAAERGRLQYDPVLVEPAALLRRLHGLGYRTQLLGDPGERAGEQREEHTLWQLLTAAAFGMQIMALSLAQLYPLYAAGRFDDPDVRRLQYLLWLLATPVLFYGGSSFLRGAWRALRARTATMDTLVALGTVAAYGYSAYISLVGHGQVYFDSVAMITTFVLVGRYLEALGGAESRKNVRNLLRLQPDRAWKRAADTWQEVEARTLVPGDIILVKPGERVPADAEVVEGQGALDESLLTGEAVPVGKGPGDTVLAGTVLADAALTCRVVQPAGGSRLAQITRLVEETLATKTPIQRLADKASAYFSLGILGVAGLTAAGWLLAGRGTTAALLAAVAVLVVACPCALGLATPLALAVTLGRTAGAGILVRNPVALETAAQTQRLVFDKTGTLTRGRMTVLAAEVATDGGTPAGLLCQAAAVEQFSEHPLARAIVAACPGPLPEAGEFQALRGLGASARLAATQRRVLVGSARFLDVAEDAPLAGAANDRAGRGETVVWVGWDGQPAGFIALGDELNPTAPAALSQLRTQGVRPVMLSGDDPRTTGAVAAALGLAEYEGNCPPQEKTARIRSWQEGGERVAMVGDGVNDAPALAQADLSMTAAGGTDVAGETSDVLLTRPDLTLVPWLIDLSRRTRRIILENLGWAFAYNLVAVPLAALGLVSPAIAAAAMAASSLLVVGNSLRLRR